MAPAPAPVAKPVQPGIRQMQPTPPGARPPDPRAGHGPRRARRARSSRSPGGGSAAAARLPLSSRRCTSTMTRRRSATTRRRPSRPKAADLPGQLRHRIRIAGNTDNRGSDEFPCARPASRAAEVMRYLVARGIAESRIGHVVFYVRSAPRGQRRATTTPEPPGNPAATSSRSTVGGNPLKLPNKSDHRSARPVHQRRPSS